jgi:hypothetical protein
VARRGKEARGGREEARRDKKGRETIREGGEGEGRVLFGVEVPEKHHIECRFGAEKQEWE